MLPVRGCHPRHHPVPPPTWSTPNGTGPTSAPRHAHPHPPFVAPRERKGRGERRGTDRRCARPSMLRALPPTEPTGNEATRMICRGRPDKRAIPSWTTCSCPSTSCSSAEDPSTPDPKQPTRPSAPTIGIIPSLTSPAPAVVATPFPPRSRPTTAPRSTTPAPAPWSSPRRVIAATAAPISSLRSEESIASVLWRRRIRPTLRRRWRRYPRRWV